MTTEQERAKKLKGLQVLIGATTGVPEAIELARSRFIEAYGRSPLHDDLAYACLLIDAYGGAPGAPVISEATVLAITTAYEQGVGKGHQSHARKEAITNPYSDEWGCGSAWQMGYDEGREQAERKASAPQPPGVDDGPSSCACCGQLSDEPRKPLTVQEYKDLHHALFMELGRRPLTDEMFLCRAIERAHGVGNT